MDSANTKLKLAAIATGITLLITGIAFMYWQVSRRYWCVRTVSISSQEVTYSWGCVHPQRYRQWSVTAQTGEMRMQRFVASKYSSPLGHDRGTDHTVPAYSEFVWEDQVGCRNWGASVESV